MHKIANKKDINPGKPFVVQLPDGREIALFNLHGEIYALNNTCPHMGGPLGEGDLEEGCISCPLHGWQFDIKTGVCTNIPGEEAKTIALEINGDEIFLKE